MMKKKMMVVGGMLLMGSPLLTLIDNGNQFNDYALTKMKSEYNPNVDVMFSESLRVDELETELPKSNDLFEKGMGYIYWYLPEGVEYQKVINVEAKGFMYVGNGENYVDNAPDMSEEEILERNFDKVVPEISFNLAEQRFEIKGIESWNKYFTSYGYQNGPTMPRFSDDFMISFEWSDDQVNDYSLANDEFDVKAINENLVSRNYPNGKKLDEGLKPYFDDGNSYREVEDYIRDNKLLASRDGIPYENIEFVFLDDDGNEIDKETKLGGSEIRLQLVSNGVNNFVIGESDVLELEIPYFVVDTYHQGVNVYDFVEDDEIGNSDPTDNMARGYWIYEGNKWVFKTNQLVGLEISAEEIDKYYVDGNWYDLWGSQRKTFEYEQVVKNESQKFEQRLQLVNNDGFSEWFGFEYEAEKVRDDDVVVSPLNTADLKVEDEMKGFDGNRNNVIDDKEILKSNAVTSPFAVEAKNEYTAFRWDYQRNGWVQLEGKKGEEGYLFEDTGLYGFSSIDEFGNNSFEVVEFVDTELNSVLVNWDITKNEFALDESLALEQGMNADEYQGKTSHEMRMVDSKRVEDDFIDLKRVAIDNDELAMITNQYQNNKVEFGMIREELENEINEQLVSYGLSREDYEVEWNHSDDEIVTTKMKLSYEIVVSGNWATKGSYKSEFEALVWNDLSEIQIPEQMLVDKTNDYMVGDEFKRLRKGLESVIDQQLRKIGVPTESLDYQWNHSDDELISGNETIKYEITSEDVVYQGMMSDVIVGESYYGLSSAEIDNDELVAISLEHEGVVFGDYRELMEAEIVRQLDAKGYPVEFIKIEWGIADSEVVKKNDVVSYQLGSKNDRFVRGGYDGEFKWGFVPPSKEDKVKLYAGFAGLILGLVVLMVIVALVQKYKRKKIRKARARVGDQYSRSEALDYLNDKDGDE